MEDEVWIFLVPAVVTSLARTEPGQGGQGGQGGQHRRAGTGLHVRPLHPEAGGGGPDVREAGGGGRGRQGPHRRTLLCSLLPGLLRGKPLHLPHVWLNLY